MCGKALNELERQMAVFKAKEYDRLDVHKELNSKEDRVKGLENDLAKVRRENDSLWTECLSLKADLEKKEQTLEEVTTEMGGL